MRSLFLSIAFLAALPMAANAATHKPAPAATSAANAASTQTVGTLRVQRYGAHGQPVILIPGLASGAWVWRDTINQLRKNHVVYAVTLAGFDGVPPPRKKTGLMDQADASLLQLIRDHHIDKPVLIGHSLGGTLAIRFATEHADMLGGVIAVDGMPVFPGMQDMTPAQREAMGKRMQTQMANATPEKFKAQQLQYMQHIGVIDPAMAKKYAALTARSDPAATAEYAAEDVAVDYRPGLKNIDVPLLEISPYNEPDFKQAAASGRMPMMSEAQKTDYYRQLLSGAPQLTVTSISPSRHFVMLDQPQRFQQVVDQFLTAHAHKP